MDESNNYNGPLAGLNVIDFGHYYAGPMTAMLLADQGANVIRIVKPGKEELPIQQYRLLNRNKKLLDLDLKTEHGKRTAEFLVEQADVVIENFRPGVMKRLGLDYAGMKKRNPGLVYLSLPGFASTDKKRCHIQAWEGVLSAASCAYIDLSPVRSMLNFPPLYTAVPRCSMYGAIHGASAVMAALLARERCGMGTVIEVPLVEAGLSAYPVSFLQASSINSGDLPDTFKPLVFSPEDKPDCQVDKLEKAQSAMFRSVYPCADGRVLWFLLGDDPRLAEQFCKLLGIDKQVKKEGFVNAGPWEGGLDNNISNSAQLSMRHRQRLNYLISEALQTKTAEQWETILQAGGVPAGLARTREEWLALQPMHSSGVFTKMNDGAAELVVPSRIADCIVPDRTRINRYREPLLLEEGKACELSRNTVHTSQNGVDSLKKGDLLKGLKVLDLANVLAGPTASYVLAQYGAEVIKADSPKGFQHPGLIATMFEPNQGKRSILNDVATEPGLEVYRRLVKWADVVLHNILDDTARRMGATHSQLRAINPNVVSCQLSAFGGSHPGGWEMRKGFDPILQCVTGLMAQYGSTGQPHCHGLTAPNDMIGGYGFAFAALLGVWQQRKHGVAGEVRTSLARITNHYQLPLMISENGRSDWSEPGGQFTVGKNWYQRFYQCRDGWIYVGARDDQVDILAETVTESRVADENSLETAFLENDCNTWLANLETVEIACHYVIGVGDIGKEGARSVTNEAADEVARESYELLRWDRHPLGAPVSFLAPTWVRVGESHSYRRLNTAPRPGEHNKQVLGELGYSEEEIDELARIGVVPDFYPPIGSKDVYLFPSYR